MVPLEEAVAKEMTPSIADQYAAEVSARAGDLGWVLMTLSKRTPAFEQDVHTSILALTHIRDRLSALSNEISHCSGTSKVSS